MTIKEKREVALSVLTLLRQSKTLWEGKPTDKACILSLTDVKLQKRFRELTAKDIEECCTIAVKALSTALERKYSKNNEQSVSEY